MAVTELMIPVGGYFLSGELNMPAHARAVIVFCHGSGSSRHSPRNKLVAAYLNEAGFGTLLFDLLLAWEDKDSRNRFDVNLLSQRLLTATEWLKANQFAATLPIAFFGASTGAAAALRAAAALPGIFAVVSRGGRPDLAGDDLFGVNAATLLLVGSLDKDVLELNRDAFQKLHGAKELTVVNGASHLFEEPGKLQEVCKLAAEWFIRHLPSPEPSPKKKEYVP